MPALAQCQRVYEGFEGRTGLARRCHRINLATRQRGIEIAAIDPGQNLLRLMIDHQHSAVSDMRVAQILQALIQHVLHGGLQRRVQRRVQAFGVALRGVLIDIFDEMRRLHI